MKLSCLHLPITLLFFITMSCKKEVSEVPAPFGVPFISTPTDTSVNKQPSFANTIWILYQYRIGSLGGQQNASDTLIFEGSKILYYNGILTKYASYFTSSGINVTLYESPWGVISSEVYSFNILQGNIIGAHFKNILNSNQLPVYLWMRRIK